MLQIMGFSFLHSGSSESTGVKLMGFIIEDMQTGTKTTEERGTDEAQLIEL